MGKKAREVDARNTPFREELGQTGRRRRLVSNSDRGWKEKKAGNRRSVHHEPLKRCIKKGKLEMKGARRQKRLNFDLHGSGRAKPDRPRKANERPGKS